MAAADDDVKTLLHIISTNTTFQIPRKKFRDYLEDYLEENPTRKIADYQRDYFKPRQTLLKGIDLQISPLSVGLYNAVVDTKSSISITNILDKVKEIGLVSENGIKITEFTVRYGKFKTAMKYTSEYGLTGNSTKPFVSADFQLKVTHDGETKGASLSFYKSGKIRFSGGYIGTPRNLETQPRELLNFLSQYHTISPTVPISLNNVTSEFRVGFPLKTSVIYDVFSDKVVKSSFGDYDIVATYETKKTHFLYLTFTKGSDKFSIIISGSGVVQIQGTVEIQTVYTFLKKFFEALKNNDFMNVGGAQNITIRKPKATKISKRFDNLPAPNITRRGTTCPVDRRPNPYSYIGKCTQTKCYIKPNPQGQPCCYTIPKSLEYSRNKVASSYNKAGVKVPDDVRALFGIGLNTNNRPVNVANKNVTPNVRIYVNNKSGFKIDTRQCLRYTKVALVDMARRLKITLPAKLTKPILCNLIKNASTLPNVNVKAGKKVITGSNATLRLGSRMCSTYKRDVIARFARTLGGAVSADMDKTAICKLIQQLSTAKRVRLQANFNRQKNVNKEAGNKKEEARKKALENARLQNIANRKKAEQNKKNALLAEKRKEREEELGKTKGARNIKARLTRNLVKTDLQKFSKQNVTNTNVDRFMTIMNRAIQNGTIKKSKTGFPLKASVEKFKRTFVVSKSPIQKPNSNSNENFNYFMNGPKA
jgi:hypothetical protein